MGNFSHQRLKREHKTIEAMVKIYCDAHHGSKADLCEECRQLLSYATKRLGLCPFQEKKPTCGNCLVHCYKQEMRDTIRKVMRYAGPRMVFRHPIMALRHLLDGRKEAPRISSMKKTGGNSAHGPDSKRRSKT